MGRVTRPLPVAWLSLADTMAIQHARQAVRHNRHGILNKTDGERMVCRTQRTAGAAGTITRDHATWSPTGAALAAGCDSITMKTRHGSIHTRSISALEGRGDSLRGVSAASCCVARSSFCDALMIAPLMLSWMMSALQHPLQALCICPHSLCQPANDQEPCRLLDGAC